IPAGRAPTACLWHDPSLDAFVTSTAFGTTFPSWARRLADHATMLRARARPWTPFDVPWLRAHVLTPDDQPGESSYVGATTCPPGLTGPNAPYAFRATPSADETLLALAEAAFEVARDSTAPALIAVSLTTHDYVLHVFGPDSWEAWDELRRLDAAL